MMTYYGLKYINTFKKGKNRKKKTFVLHYMSYTSGPSPEKNRYSLSDSFFKSRKQLHTKKTFQIKITLCHFLYFDKSDGSGLSFRSHTMRRVELILKSHFESH